MSHGSDVGEILSRTKYEEKQCEWLNAVDRYREALNIIPATDALRKGEVTEGLARALYSSAFQSEDSSEFRERMSRAVVGYGEARVVYDGSKDAKRTPRMLRCDSMIAFAQYWLAAEPSEKKACLEETWDLAKKALDALESLGEYDEFGRTYRELSRSVDILLHFEWDDQVRGETNKQAAEYGEKALKLLSPGGDAQELARIFVKTAVFLYDIEDPEERKACRSSEKVADYRLKASQLSERDSLLELISVPGVFFHSEVGEDKALNYLTKAVEFAKKARDRFALGGGFEMLSLHVLWKSYACADPEEKVELLKRALRYAEDAKQQFSPLGFVSASLSPIWTESPYDAYYLLLSSVKIDPRERRDLLSKSVEAVRERLKKAEDSGYPHALALAHHFAAWALRELVKTEPDPASKKKLLEEALHHQAETVRMHDLICPFDYYANGVALNSLANTKSFLADLTQDSETKKSILQEVILDKERSLNLSLKGMGQVGDFSPSMYSNIGLMQYRYGESLTGLYLITRDRQLLQKAIGIFSDAAESCRKPGLLSRVAECHWKAAAAHDALGDYEEAAKDFELASGDFNGAAEKTSQLRDFYGNYGLYMRAWSEIEKARYHHARSEYDHAESHFMKASELHESTKQWSYLAPNYTAWARVSHAEELSRKDQSEEALKAFREADKLFRETKSSLEARVTDIEGQDEKQMVTSLTRACDMRGEYCRARALFEQARVFEKKGDHDLSAEKYGEAVEILESVVKGLESEQERREFQFMISLSRAWQMMVQAEAETTPALYLEASRLFEEAKSASLSERAKLLTLGHSRFCKALEAGARFADSRDAALHAAAKQDLESAVDYYVKADFKNASEYAKATGLLLDAYLYMSEASKQSDPERRAKLYLMTERVLHASAGSFLRAGNPAKSEQVQRLLDNVREQRELAVSLTEVLHAPVTASTTAFPSPAPSYEQAVGLERFDNAQVQVNVIPDRKEMRVAEVLDLEIELVNPGKGAALLDRIVDAVPESFEIVEKPRLYRVEGRSINMKGKRLDPMRAEEVKLRLKPNRKGSFTVEPRVLYLDENGNVKSHEPEPVTVTVKELGIRDWIKGSG